MVNVPFVPGRSIPAGLTPRTDAQGTGCLAGQQVLGLRGLLSCLHFFGLGFHGYQFYRLTALAPLEMSGEERETEREREELRLFEQP